MATSTTGSMTATSIGTIKEIIGSATITDANGITRTLQVGDKVYANDVIQTAAGAQVEIEFANSKTATVASDSTLTLADTVFAADGQEAVDPEVAAAQARIAAGADPTEVTEAAAAGEEGGGADQEGHDIVVVAQDAAQGDVTPGFGTDTFGITVEESGEEATAPTPVITINLSAEEAVYEGSTITYTATLNNTTTNDVFITLSNGSTITVTAGQITGSVAVPAPSDDPYIDAGTISAEITNATGGGVVTLEPDTTPVSTDILDTTDDTTITLSDTTVNEGDGTATIDATVDHAVTDSPLVITLDNGATITIAVGDTTGTSTPFSIQGDDPYVDYDSYDVGISSTSGGNYENLVTTDTAKVTINDTTDDTTITLSDTTVNEGDGTATIDATVDHAVTDSPLVITLDNGATITIDVGDTTGTSTPFSIQGDDPYVDYDSYDVGISSTSGGNYENLVTTDTAKVTINDTTDDTTITLSDTTVNEGDGTATIDATVDHAVTDSPLVITLDNGETITIDAGTTSGSVTFAVQGDDAYVDGESFDVSISSTSGGNYEDLNTDDVATVTVEDTIDTTTVTLSDPTVDEGGNATIVNNARTASVNNAPDGTDLVLTLSNGETITIDAGTTSGSVTFAVQGDDAYVTWQPSRSTPSTPPRSPCLRSMKAATPPVLRCEHQLHLRRQLRRPQHR